MEKPRKGEVSLDELELIEDVPLLGGGTYHVLTPSFVRSIYDSKSLLSSSSPYPLLGEDYFNPDALFWKTVNSIEVNKQVILHS